MQFRLKQGLNRLRFVAKIKARATGGNKMSTAVIRSDTLVPGHTSYIHRIVRPDQPVQVPVDPVSSFIQAMTGVKAPVAKMPEKNPDELGIAIKPQKRNKDLYDLYIHQYAYCLGINLSHAVQLRQYIRSQMLTGKTLVITKTNGCYWR